MVKQITVKMSDENYQDLKRESQKRSMTIAGLVKAILFLQNFDGDTNTNATTN